MDAAVRFDHSEVAWHGYDDFLATLIERHEISSVLDIGGGANPALTFEQAQDKGITYTLLDISSIELDKADDRFQRIEGDIADDNLAVTSRYDLVISKMLAEHITDPAAFHRNVHALLNPGGVAFHFFPTLYAPPFIVNWLLPETLTAAFVQWLQPKRMQSARHAKFPAHYRWCRGPGTVQIARFESLGFDVDEYVGFFGHDGYYRRLSPLLAVHQKISQWLIHHPIAAATSFAYVVLRKPHGST